MVDEFCLERNICFDVFSITKGPPQLSAFVHSGSESNSEDLPNSTRQNDEKKAPTTESPKPSESSPQKKDEKEDDAEEEEEEEGSGGGGTGFSSFLQLLQAVSGGGIRVPSNSGDTDGVQGLLARLGFINRKLHVCSLN